MVNLRNHSKSSRSGGNEAKPKSTVDVAFLHSEKNQILGGDKTQFRFPVECQPRLHKPSRDSLLYCAHVTGDYYWPVPGVSCAGTISCNPHGPDGWERFCKYRAGDKFKVGARKFIITKVRIERLKAISHGDAVSEGIEIASVSGEPGYRNYQLDNENLDMFPSFETDARLSFFSLYASKFGNEQLDLNAWMWVIEFVACRKVVH